MDIQIYSGSMRERIGEFKNSGIYPPHLNPLLIIMGEEILYSQYVKYAGSLLPSVEFKVLEILLNQARHGWQMIIFLLSPLGRG